MTTLTVQIGAQGTQCSICVCVASHHSIAWLFPVFFGTVAKRGELYIFSSSHLRPPTNVAQLRRGCRIELSHRNCDAIATNLFQTEC